MIDLPDSNALTYVATSNLAAVYIFAPHDSQSPVAIGPSDDLGGALAAARRQWPRLNLEIETVFWANCKSVQRIITGIGRDLSDRRVGRNMFAVTVPIAIAAIEREARRLAVELRSHSDVLASARAKPERGDARAVRGGPKPERE